MLNKQSEPDRAPSRREPNETRSSHSVEKLAVRSWLSPRNWSLQVKLVGTIAGLLASIALFLVLFFPARMESFSRRWMERRAVGMAVVVADGASAGVDLDDSDAVRDVLKSLSSAPDVLYAIVRRANGEPLATWKADRAAAAFIQVGDTPSLVYSPDELRVDARVRGKGGATGVLSLGFSLVDLEHEKVAHRWVTAAVSLVVFVTGLLASILLSRLLVAPIGRMTQIALRIAAGDLSHGELGSQGTDELGRMEAAFNAMLASLRALASAADRMARGDLTTRVEIEGDVGDAFNRMLESQESVVRQIAETSVQLAGAAAEIYAATQEQEAAAARQSVGVEEVSRTMQSLLESASHIADSTRGVLANAERTKQTADATSTRIAELSTHTNRMGELLDSIRDIADRSDLLALNASLEATRAGEAGRAFSLVAAEVRRLAERVTASVQDVKSLVADVRSSGTSAVMTTDEGRKLAESTTDSARQITFVTQQQRTGTEQVSQSMQDIAALLSQSTSAAQQTRSSAELLKTHAERLAEVVGRFEIGPHHDGPRR